MSGALFQWGVPIPFAILIVLGCVFVLVSGWRELSVVEPVRRRHILRFLRTATALIGALIALQPSWFEPQVSAMKGQLAVLFDHSRSMTVGYRSGVRLDAVEAVARAMGKEGFAAPLYAFGDEAVPVSRSELVGSPVNLRDRTDLTASIRSVLDEDVDRSLGAVLVVSDGSDAAALEAAQSLRDYGVRIHTVSVGGDEVLNDDSIRSVEADPIGFLRQQGVLRVTVRSAQPSRSTIPLTLRLGEEVLRETQVPLNALGEGTVELPFVPHTLGRNVYRLTLGLTPEDSVPENNERYVLIRVLRDRLRVLLVAGRPSWDVRFLRAFLKRDPAIDLISFFILRTGSDLTMAAPEQLALIPFPTDELFREHLGSFDVIVFQNFDYGPYQMAMYLPQIRNYVRRGGAFAMIGGEQSFASGGYGGTPVAE
ncbi:MAG: vWA domain-containing protein, partial [Myxococcota bacterium]